MKKVISIMIGLFVMLTLSSPSFAKNELHGRRNGENNGIGAGGPGVDFFFNRHFTLHVELPWMTLFKVADGKTTFSDSHPHFGGGFVYYF